MKIMSQPCQYCSGFRAVLVLIISFCCLTIILPFNQANAKVLVTRGHDQLLQTDVQKLITAGEKIAHHSFSDEEKQALRTWTIEFFKKEKNLQAIKKTFNKISRYHELASQNENTDIKHLIWHHLYREMVFKWRFVRYKKNQLTLLDVIQRYNPILKRLDKEKLILTKKDPLLATAGNYFFTHNMRTSLQVVADFLAHQPVPQNDLKNLFKWAEADFNYSPKNASQVYAYFYDHAVPNALSPSSRYAQEKFRSDMYQRYYFAFLQDSFAKKWSSDLMDVVTRHNPVLISDELGKRLVAQSELDARLEMIDFFSAQLGLGLQINRALQNKERNLLILGFIGKKPKGRYAGLRLQDFWKSLPNDEKNKLASEINQQFRKSHNFWQALTPLSKRLDTIINLENRQKLAKQHILNNIILQNMQMNQINFSHVLKTQKQAADLLADSIKDSGTRSAVQLSGGRILGDDNEVYTVKSADGTIYKIQK
jgi:hypothetical protein